LGEVSLFGTKIKNGGVGSSMIAIIAEIAKLKTKPFNEKGHEGTQSEADVVRVGNLGIESEVRVNRFEGHRAQHAFRPKVNGWTEGTKRELA
jgi:hypothetical protein